MTTKSISGAYPSGYYLNPRFTTLNILTGGSVGGAGVTTSATQASTINNKGFVDGTQNGITLSDGGRLANGGTTDATSLIEGVVGVRVAGKATVTNFGTIASSAGASGTAVSFGSADDTLVEEASGVLAGQVVGGGGTLELGAGAGTIGGLGSSITGFDTITVDAGAGWRFAGANTLAFATLRSFAAITLDGTFTNKGEISASSIIRLASGSTLDNTAAGGGLLLAGDVGVARQAGATGTSLVNAGLLEKQSGTGVSGISVSLADTGQIIVHSGTLDLSGPVNTVDGTIKGAGTIEFTGGVTTLGPSTTIGTAAWSVSGAGTRLTVDGFDYENTFTVSGGVALTINGRLTLGGGDSFSGATINGDGLAIWTTASASVSAVTLGGAAEWGNSGFISAIGQFTLGDEKGDKALFVNFELAGFDIMGDTGIGVGSATTSQFTNDGWLSKTGGTGTSVIAVKVYNPGTIDADSGVLDFIAAVTGNGALDVGAGAVLEFGSGVAKGGRASFTGAGGVLQLDDASAFGASVANFGSGETIDLRSVAFGSGETVGYSGTTVSGTLTVTAGSNTEKIALLGQYVAANFQTSSDGHGGTDVTFLATPATAPALASPGL